MSKGKGAGKEGSRKTQDMRKTNRITLICENSSDSAEREKTKQRWERGKVDRCKKKNSSG